MVMKKIVYEDILHGSKLHKEITMLDLKYITYTKTEKHKLN